MNNSTMNVRMLKDSNMWKLQVDMILIPLIKCVFFLLKMFFFSLLLIRVLFSIMILNLLNLPRTGRVRDKTFVFNSPTVWICKIKTVLVNDVLDKIQICWIVHLNTVSFAYEHQLRTRTDKDKGVNAIVNVPVYSTN